jgi:hypothetical protein
MTGHWLAEAGDDQARDAIAAMKSSLLAIDCRNLAVTMLFNSAATGSQPVVTLDLDENLLGSK